MAEIPITFFAVLIVYLSVIIGIGIHGFRRTHTEEDFLTAGRTIGPWVGGATLAATQISAGTLVGTIGRHYQTGVSWAWVWPGVWLGWMVSAIFVAPKLRDFGAVTIPDFFAVRFNSKNTRALSAAFILAGYLILLVAQYQACGEIFQVIFNIKPVYAMLILISSTLVYTALGGIRSSSYIDFLQILIVLCGLVFAVPLVMHRTGGINIVGEYLQSLNPRLTGWWYSWKQIVGFALAFGLTIAAAPYEMVRFYSMRDKATVRYAIGVCFIFQAIIGCTVLILGLSMRMIFPNLSSVDQTSSIMALNVLSPIAGSLFLVAMISAIMSVTNAILLVISACISHDIYGRLINPRSSEQTRLMLNRVSIVCLGLVPAWFALQRFTDVQSLVVLGARFMASSFFIPTILGLNFRGGSAASAMSSMFAGFLGCLFWTVFGNELMRGIDPIEVGILSSALLYFLVSNFTKGVSAEHLKVFFRQPS